MDFSSFEGINLGLLLVAIGLILVGLDVLYIALKRVFNEGDFGEKEELYVSNYVSEIANKPLINEVNFILIGEVYDKNLKTEEAVDTEILPEIVNYKPKLDLSFFENWKGFLVRKENKTPRQPAVATPLVEGNWFAKLTSIFRKLPRQSSDVTSFERVNWFGKLSKTPGQASSATPSQAKGNRGNLMNWFPKFATGFGLSLVILSLILGFLPSPRPVQVSAASLPVVSGSIPSAVSLGENFNFTLNYNNTGSTEGYAPYIDIFVPTIGVDGAGLANIDDGITLNSASYLGVNLPITSLTFPETGIGCGVGLTPLNHPLAVDNAGLPLVVCGTPGNKLAVIALPFGSFVPTQSPAAIDFTAILSNLADSNTPLNIQYRGGFRFGNDALNNPFTDPTIVGNLANSNVTPVLFAVSKSYNGPENETATGPNFRRRYTVSANLANGQTVTNLDLTDKLPNNLAYLSLISSSPAGGVVLQSPTVGSAANPPNNQLTIRFPSVTGGSGANDATMVFEYFVPDRDANNNFVINHTSGDDVISQDDASASATWTPIDTRDAPTIITSDATPVDHTLTDKSIAIQKSFQNISQAQNHPGDTIKYTLNFQISDYFAFQNLVTTDIFSDGQSFDTSFPPTLSVTEAGSTTTGNFNGANFNYLRDTGYGGATGDTTVNFNVSNELVTRSLDARVLGGCSANINPSTCLSNVGAATGTIVFQTKIDDVFTDDYGSGDPSLNMGDTLSNNVTISGDVLNNSTLVPTGQSEADTSGVSFDIMIGSLEKTIYAVNGVINPPAPVKIGPGDEITYRLKYNLALADVENFYMEDFLPLPALTSVGFSNVFNTTISATPPPTGTAKFGPSDTFFGISGITPVVSSSTPENKISFNFGAFQDPVNQTAVSDVLLTVTANNQPFADGLNLVNQARARATNTFSTEQTANAIVPVVLTVPEVSMKKGIVSTDSLTPVYTPATNSPVAFNAPGSTTCTAPNHRFSGNINSSNLATTPINSDLSGVDAGDKVTFALTLENKGTGPRGAFDLKVRDVIPVGMQVPSGGLNLCVTRGDGTVLSYTAVNGGDTNPLVQNGIELTDPSPLEGAAKAYDPLNPSAGDNVVIVSYDLEASPTISPRQTLTNTAHFFNYSGANGGTANFVPNGDQTDTAILTTSAPLTAKTITATNQADSTGNNVLVGEIITYQVVTTVPEGQLNSAQLVDTLDPGLALVSLDSLTSSSGNLTTNAGGGFAGVLSGASVTNSGKTITLNLGNLTNSDTNNAVNETLTLVYKVVVVNASQSVRGANLNNSVALSYNNGTPQTEASVSAPNVTVIEPQLNVVKTISSATGDGNDLLTYTLTISNGGSSNAPSYDVNLSDIIPATLTYQAATLTNTSGVLPASLTESSGTISASYTKIDVGQTSVIQFQVRPLNTLLPAQVVPNTANLTYTSLPTSIITTQSPYEPNATERTGSNLNPGGALNNYTSTSTVNFTVNNVGLTKTIVSTSEAHTTATNRLAIGEIIRYRLATSVPESEISNFRIRDNLPAGMQFLDDGTASVGFSSNGNLVSDIPAFSSCNQVGSSATITPTCAIPPVQISGGPFTDSTDPIFSIGKINNTDNDANLEYVVIEFNAQVLNVVANQAFNNATGAALATTLNNNYSAIRAGTPSDVTMATSANLAVQIAEPVIRNLTKTLTQTPIDAGDPFTYRLTFSNTASGTTGTTGFEINLKDTLNSNLQLNTITVVSKPVTTTVTDSSNIPGGIVDLVFSQLAITESVTVDLSGVVLNTVSNGQIIPNTANLTYTSLPGSGTIGNATGSNILNLGTSTSERNGSTTPALNDYTSSSTLNLTITTGAINKTNTAGSTFRIGDEPEFDLTSTIAEGLNKSVRVRDTLPSGLEYVSAQVITTAAGSGGLLTQDFSGSLPAPTITGSNPVTFDFGDVTLPSDNISANDSFVVRVKTRVRDVVGNQNGTVLVNNASLITQNVSTLVDQTSTDLTPPSVTLTVPILGVTKSFIPNTAAPNDNVSFQIQVANTGGATAYEVNLSDSILNANLTNLSLGSTPAGFTGLLTPSGPNTILTYTGGDILAGQTLTFTVNATIPSNLTNGQVINNTATLTQASTLSGPSIYERSFGPINGSGSLTVQTPDIAIIKTDGVTTIAPGNTATYNLTVSNVGTFKGDNVIITETLPANTTFNAAASLPSVWTNAGGGIYTLNLGTINAGSNKTAKFAVTINNPAPAGVNQIINTATASDDGTHGVDPNLANNTTTDTDTLNAAPDLTITKTDGVVATTTNDTLTYTLTISNVGNQDATGVVITDTLPSNVAYQSSSNLGSLSLGVVTWPTINLAGGASIIRTVTVQVNPTIPSGVNSIVNSASVQNDNTNGADPTPGNNTATDTDTLNAAPDLTITKTDGLTNVVPGNTVSYTLSITNNGNQDSTGVVVTDILPSSVSYISSSNSGSNTLGTVTWPNFNLAVGATVTRTVTVQVNSTVPAGQTTIVNNANVNDDGTNGADINPADNSTSDTDTLTAAPDIAVTKTNTQTVVSPNQTLTYQIAVVNNGNQAGTNVLVTETVPANSIYKSSGSSSWSCPNNSVAGATCTLNIANLNGGATQNLTFVVLVNSSIPAGVNTFANTVNALDDGTNGPDLTDDNTFTDTDTLNATPDITITKTDGLATVTVNDILTYTLTISNVGNQNATGVVITDTLPSNVVYQTSSNSGSLSLGVVTWPTINLAAGASVTRTVTVQVNSSIPAGVNNILNSATASDDGTNGTDPTPLNNTATDTDILNAAPDLAVTIDDGNISTTPGSIVNYTVNYSNIGIQDASGTIISVTVPINSTFDLANSTPGFSCSNGAVGGTICNFNKGSLNTGETGSLNFAVKVNPTLPSGVTQINVPATISDDGANGTEISLLNNNSSDFTPLTAAPDLLITKTDGQITAIPGQVLTYTLTIVNIGNQDATGVVVTDTLANNVAYQSSSNSGSNSLGTVTWPAFNLAAGSTVFRTVTVQVNSSIPSLISNLVNNAEVNDDGTNGSDPTPLNNFASDTDILDAAPDLVVTKTDNGATATPGTQINYTINYANNGNQTATNVVVSDQVPLYTKYISAGLSSWSCLNNSPSGTNCTISIGTLAPGATGSLTFVLEIDPTLPPGIDDIFNTVTIADDGNNGPDPTPLNNTNTEITTSNATPDLVVNKTDNGVSKQPGENLLYNITYSNDGNQTATNVVLTETVPADSIYVASGSGSWSCSDGAIAGTSCTINLGSLNPGQSGNTTFVVKINPSLPSGVIQTSNTVTIADDGTNGPDGNPSDNSSTDPTPLQAAPNLKITKTDGLSSINNGQNYTYTLTIENIGNQDSTGVVVTDTLPPNVTANTISDSGTESLGVVTWPGFSLAVGQTVVRSVDVTFSTGATLAPGIENVNNQANVSDDGTNGPDLDGSDNQAFDLDTVNGNPDLQVTIDDGQTTVNPGQTLTYNIESKNVGSQDASNSTLTLNIPAGQSYVPAGSTPGWNCILQVCTLNLGTIVAADTINSVIVLQIDNPSNVDTVLVPVSIADDGLGGADPTPLNNQASDEDNIVGDPNLTIVKSDGLSILSAGQETEYTLTVTNNGNILTTGINLVDTYPNSFSFVSASNSGVDSPSLNQVTWPAFQLIPNQTVTFTVKLKLADVVPSGLNDITNGASVSDDGIHGVDTNPTDNTTEDTDTVDAAPDLKITETLLTTEIYPTQTLTYKLDYGNVGNQNSTGVILAFVIPTNTEYVPTPGWTCSDIIAGSTCTFLVGNLNVGDTGSQNIQVKIISNVNPLSRQIQNVASIVDDGNNGAEITLVNNNDLLNTIIPMADLIMEKTVDKTQAKIQEELTYKFIYRNLGPDTATGIVFEDILPQELQFISTTLDGNPVPTTATSIGGGQTRLNFSVPDIGPGIEKFLLVKTKIIRLPNGNSIVNNATVRAREIDPEVSNNRSNASIKIIKEFPDIEIVRTGGDDTQISRFVLSVIISLIGLAVFRASLKGFSRN